MLFHPNWGSQACTNKTSMSWIQY